MEYQYSDVVDPSTFDYHGLCPPLQTRVSKFDHLSNEGTRTAQDDWRRLVGKRKDTPGSIGRPFNFISLVIPECLPDRIYLATYANEFGFLHDGNAFFPLRELSD